MRAIMPFLLTGILVAALVQAQQREEETEDRTEVSGKRHIVTLQRTERSETVGESGGTACMTRIYAKPRYRRENGEWQPITLASRSETRYGYPRAIQGNEYISRFDPSSPERGMRFERDGYYVTYTPTGKWTGRTVKLKHFAEGIKETVILSRESDMRVCWKVETNARMESKNGGLIFSDTNEREVFRVPKPDAWDARGIRTPVTATLTGDTLECSLSLSPDTEWPVYLDPTTAIGDIDVKTGFMSAVSRTYAGARDTTSATVPDNANIAAWVGQQHDGTYYRVFRTSLLFDTSSLPDAATIDSAKVILVTNYDGVESNFDMELVTPTFAGSWTKSWYNDFIGWTAGSVYGVTTLSAILNSSVCRSVGDTCRFRLNAAGIDSIKKSGETKFMLLSLRDINNTPPNVNSQERLGFEEDSPYIMVWYHLPVNPPANFTMTALDSATVVCTWNDMSSNESKFLIVNQADLTVVDSTAANAVADTIRGLSMNTRYIWAAAADSGGVRSYSDPDTVWTKLNPPQWWQVHIRPISSDTLRVSVDTPVNGTSGSTGMEVKVISGPGASSSGWLTGSYAFRDGGLNPDSSYVYKIRYRNGAGDSTVWTPESQYSMKGRATLTLNLARDANDDYNVNFGAGMRDSTVVRVGKSDTGQRLDGFLTFRLPWQVQNGGVDSMFVSLTRTSERSNKTPAAKVYAVPVKNLAPVETLNLGALDSTSATTSWTISSAAGSKTSPNLRNLFRAWQDLSSNQNYSYGFGLRLDDGNPADSVRAVFLDFSNPSYNNDTRLTIYYTPGAPDTLKGAPSNLVLSVLAPDSIRASWTDGATGEYGYVLLNLPDSTRVAGTDTLTANSTSATVGGLTPNTVYQWTVKAFTYGNARAATGVSARTLARTPGRPTLSATASARLRFILDPRDNPMYTEFAVQDSASGKFVDPGTTPHALREGPLGEWGWRTFAGWGAAQGDSVTGLGPNERHGLRVKAR